MAEVIPIGPRTGLDRCRAITTKGTRCRNRASEHGYCGVHLKHEPQAHWEDGLARALTFLRLRLTGDYEVDEFGYDPELTQEVFNAIARFLHETWWRVDWIGMEHVPSEGPALLVANHAGTLPWDAVVTKFGILDKHPAHRNVRLLAADLVFRMPFLGAMARKSGNTLATTEDAYRLLARGELVGVTPEGFKGVGKPFKDRYKLQRFGRGGFIEVALRARVPIIPVSIVGSEEIYPLLYNAKPLARLFGFPYFPITPTFPWLGPLGVIPLPSKWIVEFGEPIETGDMPEDAWQDALTVFDMNDRVREVIQQTLYRNLMARRSVWF